MHGYEFYVDPSRCIGCRSCEAACAECETHRGVPMISVDFLDRSLGTETVPTVCMHCDDPTCAQVCPEVFEVRNDGFLYILIEEPGEPLHAAVAQAADMCPTGAITIE